MSINNDWDFHYLESLIQSRGDEVIHETGVACPCRSDDTYSSLTLHENRHATRRRLDCEQCGGSGWVYRDAKVVKGLVTGVESGRNRQLLEVGYAVPGDCVFSPSLHLPPLADFDRITFLYPAPVSEGQIIMRNGANMNDTAMLNLNLSSSEDRLWYYADCSIWCEDENGVLYTQGINFELDEKIIRWIGPRPADGVFYTIKYNAYLEWIIYSTPMTRFDRDRSLGQRVLLRKLHVAAQNDYEFDTPAKRQEKESSFTSKTTI